MAKWEKKLEGIRNNPHRLGVRRRHLQAPPVYSRPILSLSVL